MSLTITKRSVSCSHCRVRGHNKRTCPSRNVTLRTTRRNKMREESRVCGNTSEKTVCSICLDECGDYKTTLECGHTFDTNCIFSWLSKNVTCPCCRAEVSQLKKSTSSIKLPAYSVVGAVYKLCEEAVGERFTSLSAAGQVHAWYIMFKTEIESLSSEQYEEFVALGDGDTQQFW